MPITLAVPAMATRFEVVLAGLAEPDLRSAGEEALEEVLRLEALVSPFRRDSQVAHLLRQGPGVRVGLAPELLELLALCLELRAATKGAFEPFVAVDGSGSSGSWHPEPPLALDLDGGVAVWNRSGVRVDLGAIGKGWAVDRALDVLAGAGVPAALVHGGTSSVGALGAPPGRPGWGVLVPRGQETGELMLTSGQALGVSAPLGSHSEPRSAEHVVDRRTGTAVARAAAAVAVVARSAAVADAWSTAYLVDPTLTGGPGIVA